MLESANAKFEFHLRINTKRVIKLPADQRRFNILKQHGDHGTTLGCRLILDTLGLLTVPKSSPSTGFCIQPLSKCRWELNWEPRAQPLDYYDRLTGYTAVSIRKDLLLIDFLWLHPLPLFNCKCELSTNCFWAMKYLSGNSQIAVLATFCQLVKMLAHVFMKTAFAEINEY